MKWKLTGRKYSLPRRVALPGVTASGKWKAGPNGKDVIEMDDMEDHIYTIPLKEQKEKILNIETIHASVLENFAENEQRLSRQRKSYNDVWDGEEMLKKSSIYSTARTSLGFSILL